MSLTMRGTLEQRDRTTPCEALWRRWSQAGTRSGGSCQIFQTFQVQAQMLRVMLGRLVIMSHSVMIDMKVFRSPLFVV